MSFNYEDLLKKLKVMDEGQLKQMFIDLNDYKATYRIGFFAFSYIQAHKMMAGIDTMEIEEEYPDRRDNDEKELIEADNRERYLDIKAAQQEPWK